MAEFTAVGAGVFVGSTTDHEVFAGSPPQCCLARMSELDLKSILAQGVLLLLLIERPIQSGNLGRDSRPAQKTDDLTWVLRANLHKRGIGTSDLFAP